ncbi:MAG: ATP-binding domain-containing protein, partial [Bacteroidota bacterium]
REGDLERVQFLTYSNWQAVKVNQAIRQQLFFSEEMLVPSELVMVVKNNYAWGDSKRMPFVANGEMGTIRHVDNDTYEERYGLKWVNAEIEFQDVRGEPLVLEGKVVLSLLQEKSPQLASEFRTRVWQERKAEYLGQNPKKAAELLRGDPYLNALQIKYGYAITGHKSQGGQWGNVLIGFEPDYGRNPLAYIRWAYTALTRAQERVFLMNCPFVQ